MTGTNRTGSKPTAAKPVETKVAETKLADVKPVDTKPAETKPPLVAAAPVVSPAASAKPEPASVAAPAKASPEGAGSGQDDVAKAVNQWAAAWARKDVRGYLAVYAKDFKTPNGLARNKWEAERRSRIDKPGTISVKLDGMKISVDGDKATARFRQSYEAGAFKATAGKALDMVRRDGKWQIQQERVGG
jgi:ketosteroid isomerase-like protein